MKLPGHLTKSRQCVCVGREASRAEPTGGIIGMYDVTQTAAGFAGITFHKYLREPMCAIWPLCRGGDVQDGGVEALYSGDGTLLQYCVGTVLYCTVRVGVVMLRRCSCSSGETN